jgi:hypothetical protein
MDLITYILKISQANSYAAKYKIGSMWKVFQIAGWDLNRRLKSDQRSNAMGLTEEQGIKGETIKPCNFTTIKILEVLTFNSKIFLYTNRDYMPTYVKIVQTGLEKTID